MDLDPFKLEKLTIYAFKTGDRSGKPSGDSVFEAMFNPASYTQTFANNWSAKPVINGTTPELKFTAAKPSELNLTITLDGTGVNDIGLLTLMQPSVSDRIQNFLSVTYNYDGDIHEPNYLAVQWGNLSFFCRLKSVDIKYTTFDRDGTPLRAELTAKFLADETADQSAQEKKANSPDLTHSRVVRSGDTLPLLTKQIYGSSARYLDVARWNELDDFRNLTPGQTLLFPPLASFADANRTRGQK